MYQNTITVFNFHAASGLWYLSVIHGADLIASKSSTATVEGRNNADAVEIIIHCSAERTVDTTAGLKSYTGPKEYAKSDNPAEHEKYDSGLYHAMNDEHDGIYMISSAAFYGLLPHFEIGGR